MGASFAAGLLASAVLLLFPLERRDGPGGSGAPARPFEAPPPDNASLPPGAVPAIPPVPRLAIVIDDLGYEPARDAEWLSFPRPATVAVLPFGPASRRIADSAHDRGFGVLLHVPMEPEGEAPDRTEGLRLLRGMERDEMARLLDRMIRDVPHAVGASNHMGSAFTADPAAMSNYLSLLEARNLFLFDSYTTARSVAVPEALRANVPVVRRDVFLDADPSLAAMREQWERALATAAGTGRCVLVAHARPETRRFLQERLPELAKAGIEPAFVADLAVRPEETGGR